MNGWFAFEKRTTIGAIGSEGGAILRDEMHPDGARITLERTATRFAITCGVYGWMVHTRFFATESEAVAAYEEMKPALAEILARLPGEDLEAAIDEVAILLGDEAISVARVLFLITRPPRARCCRMLMRSSPGLPVRRGIPWR